MNLIGINKQMNIKYKLLEIYKKYHEYWSTLTPLMKVSYVSGFSSNKKEIKEWYDTGKYGMWINEENVTNIPASQQKISVWY